jgi:hypothetical protein
MTMTRDLMSAPSGAAAYHVHSTHVSAVAAVFSGFDTIASLRRIYGVCPNSSLPASARVRLAVESDPDTCSNDDGGLMLAHQVAAKAFRDTTFLTAWPATALPMMTLATALFTATFVPSFRDSLNAIPPWPSCRSASG